MKARGRPNMGKWTTKPLRTTRKWSSFRTGRVPAGQIRGRQISVLCRRCRTLNFAGRGGEDATEEGGSRTWGHRVPEPQLPPGET